MTRERIISALRERDAPMTTADLFRAMGDVSLWRMREALNSARADGVIRVARVTRGPTGYVNYEWELAAPHPSTLTVYEPEEARRTGLLDIDGNPLVRQREPIGFKVTK